MMVIVHYISIVLFALLSVAFFTLLERKVLGYIQLRKGPNKVGFMGIPQPFSDAVKLFTKEYFSPINSNMVPFLISPALGLVLALVLWLFYGSVYSGLFFKFALFMIFCISAMGVYVVIGAGWTSNSKYALLGALRAVAQSISYEVSLSCLGLFVVLLMGSFLFVDFLVGQTVMYLFLCFPVFLMWVVSGLAETNRAPFDFAEGESELVSGFNVEYGGLGFAMLFMAEYSNILFFSVVTVVLFLGGSGYFLLGMVVYMMKFMFIAFVFLWARGSLPRFRYDLLMMMAWKVFLPVILSVLLFELILLILL